MPSEKDEEELLRELLFEVDTIAKKLIARWLVQKKIRTYIVGSALIASGIKAFLVDGFSIDAAKAKIDGLLDAVQLDVYSIDISPRKTHRGDT